MSFRRMVPYLLLVILVSAAVQLAILYWWDNRERAEVVAVATPTAAILTIDPNVPAADSVQTDAAEPDTAEPDAPSGPTIHTVQAGDTLGSISTRYDVSMEDIMAANGLTNPNLLSIGQTLTIPIGGLATPTPAATATPDPALLPTPIPTEAPSLQGEAILEISILNPGVSGEESLQIINVGTRQASLANWTLRDGNRVVYTFGQVTIFGEGAGILVHTGSGNDGPTDLYLRLASPIWQSGDSVNLHDAAGTVQATYLVP